MQTLFYTYVNTLNSQVALSQWFWSITIDTYANHGHICNQKSLYGRSVENVVKPNTIFH